VAILIVAGVPQRAFRRHNFVEPAVQAVGWTVEVFGSKRNHPSVVHCWDDVRNRVAQIDAGDNSQSVHIFAFDHDEKGFITVYSRGMRDHHRVRRLPSNLVQIFGTDDFNEHLTAMLRIEEQWRNALRPRHFSEPVILPENLFEVPTPFNDVWKRVRDFDGTDSVDAIQSLISNFKKRYRTDKYRDQRGLLFDSGGARHGQVRGSAIGNWKYSLRLHDSFHFDVMDERKQPFGFQCRDQSRRIYNTHCNVDAFGFEVARGR